MSLNRVYRGRRLSDGAKALRLITDQRGWTHRRVESLAFLPSGEARRRVSWDYTLPLHLAIAAAADRVAVPIATLKKRPLKRLDVSSASGSALSVWGKAENGWLAEEALVSGFEALTGSLPGEEERRAINSIVYGPSLDAVQPIVDQLLERHESGAADLAIAFRAVAETLADNFLFVVEVPVDTVGRRSLIKINYDDSRDLTPGRGSFFAAEEVVSIDGQGWSEAASWHLEVHAPAGLVVERLWFESWEADSLDVVDFQEDQRSPSTAHVTSTHLRRDLETSARAVLRPARPGLLNQVTVGAGIALLLLFLARMNSERLSELILASGQGSALAALAFSLPAFFLALLARSSEHELVSRVLAGPRLAALLSGAELWSAGVCFVLRTSSEALTECLSVLTVTQLAILGWLLFIRNVGGRA